MTLNLMIFTIESIHFTLTDINMLQASESSLVPSMMSKRSLKQGYNVSQILHYQANQASQRFSLSLPLPLRSPSSPANFLPNRPSTKTKPKTTTNIAELATKGILSSQYPFPSTSAKIPLQKAVASIPPNVSTIPIPRYNFSTASLLSNNPVT